VIKFTNIGISPKQTSYLTGDIYEICYEEKFVVGYFKRGKHEKFYFFVQGHYGWPMTADSLRAIADKLDELNIRDGLLGEGGE
jgi:hypothetical protein